MNLEFEDMPRIFPTMAVWGASTETHSFVISKDGDEPYLASVKRKGSLPFQGARTDLGSFNTLDDAKQGCEAFARGYSGSRA